jgi:hypothetical protein
MFSGPTCKTTFVVQYAETVFSRVQNASNSNNRVKRVSLHRKYLGSEGVVDRTVFRWTKATPEGKGDDDDRVSDETHESINIQESLVKSLNFEIGAKRNLDQHVQESGEKLKALAEDAKEEMDKAAELAKLRSDLAFDSALADINREAEKFERKLRQRREKMEQEEQQMNDWVKDVDDSRNEGQFFGNLYGALSEEEDGRPRTYSEMDQIERTQAMEKRKRILEPAEVEVRSPARMYIFGLIGSTLVVNIVADLLNSEKAPAIGLDCLYGALAVYSIYLVVCEHKAIDAHKD